MQKLQMMVVKDQDSPFLKILEPVHTVRLNY